MTANIEIVNPTPYTALIHCSCAPGGDHDVDIARVDLINALVPGPLRTFLERVSADYWNDPNGLTLDPRLSWALRAMGPNKTNLPAGIPLVLDADDQVLQYEATRSDDTEDFYVELRYIPAMMR
jgi:hypothetical protein